VPGSSVCRRLHTATIRATANRSRDPRPDPPDGPQRLARAARSCTSTWRADAAARRGVPGEAPG